MVDSTGKISRRTGFPLDWLLSWWLVFRVLRLTCFIQKGDSVKMTLCPLIFFWFYG